MSITNCGACQYSVKLLFFFRWQLLSTYTQFHFPSFCMCVSLLLNILTFVTGCLMYLNNPPSQPQPSPLWVRLPHPQGPCPTTPGAPQLGCPPGARAKPHAGGHPAPAAWGLGPVQPLPPPQAGCPPLTPHSACSCSPPPRRGAWAVPMPLGPHSLEKEGGKEDREGVLGFERNDKNVLFLPFFITSEPQHILRV